MFNMFMYKWYLGDSHGIGSYVVILHIEYYMPYLFYTEVSAMSLNGHDSLIYDM